MTPLVQGSSIPVQTLLTHFIALITICAMDSHYQMVAKPKQKVPFPGLQFIYTPRDSQEEVDRQKLARHSWASTVISAIV